VSLILLIIGVLVRPYKKVREEWENLSQSDRSHVIRAGEHLETARTVAASLRDQADSQGDNLSTLTPAATNTRSNAGANAGMPTQHTSYNLSQVSLNNASQAMTCQHVGAIITVQLTRSNVSNVSSLKQRHPIPTTCRAELARHVDTCAVNHSTCIIEQLGKVAEVSNFASSLDKLQNSSIVKAALAYDDLETGKTLVLIFNQALYFEDQLPNILLNPNQMRMQGLTVNDCPKHLSRGKSTNSIKIEEENIMIPLCLRGIMSYFNVCNPTLEEIEECMNINMTPVHIEWEPYSDFHMEQESEFDSEHIREKDYKIDIYNTSCPLMQIMMSFRIPLRNST
jgi:hypothetical protein